MQSETLLLHWHFGRCSFIQGKWQVLWITEHQDFAGTLLQGKAMLLSWPSHKVRYENPYSVVHSAGVEHMALPVDACQRLQTLSTLGETEAGIKAKCQTSNMCWSASINVSQGSGYIHKYPAPSEKMRAVTGWSLSKIFLFTEKPKWDFMVEPCAEQVPEIHHCWSGTLFPLRTEFLGAECGTLRIACWKCSATLKLNSWAQLGTYSKHTVRSSETQIPHLSIHL